MLRGEATQTPVTRILRSFTMIFAGYRVPPPFKRGLWCETCDIIQTKNRDLTNFNRFAGPVFLFVLSALTKLKYSSRTHLIFFIFLFGYKTIARRARRRINRIWRHTWWFKPEKPAHSRMLRLPGKAEIFALHTIYFIFVIIGWFGIHNAISCVFCYYIIIYIFVFSVYIFS